MLANLIRLGPVGIYVYVRKCWRQCGVLGLGLSTSPKQATRGRVFGARMGGNVRAVFVDESQHPLQRDTNAQWLLFETAKDGAVCHSLRQESPWGQTEVLCYRATQEACGSLLPPIRQQTKNPKSKQNLQYPRGQRHNEGWRHIAHLVCFGHSLFSAGISARGVVGAGCAGCWSGRAGGGRSRRRGTTARLDCLVGYMHQNALSKPETPA